MNKHKPYERVKNGIWVPWSGRSIPKKGDIARLSVANGIVTMDERPDESDEMPHGIIQDVDFSDMHWALEDESYKPNVLIGWNISLTDVYSVAERYPVGATLFRDANNKLTTAIRTGGLSRMVGMMPPAVGFVFRPPLANDAELWWLDFEEN